MLSAALSAFVFAGSRNGREGRSCRLEMLSGIFVTDEIPNNMDLDKAEKMEE
jgi:hypothetical protein